MLEHTIGYEQLAVDLTAILAQRVTCPHVKSALDFALLEDFDHLYRYADLLEMDSGVYGEHHYRGRAANHELLYERLRLLPRRSGHRP